MSQILAPVGGTAPSPASLRRVFVAGARSEWIKLRTVRSTIWALVLTVIFAIGLGALFTAIEVSRWDHRTLTEIKGFDPLLYSFAGLNLAQLSIGVLGVLVLTSEYSTGTIKLTLGATPQRSVLLAAKVATFSAVVAVVGLASCFAAFWVCQAILAPKHAGLSISDPGVLRAVIGGALHLVLIGAIAVALGAAIRRTAGPVAVLFAVLLVVPGLVTLLPSPGTTTSPGTSLTRQARPCPPLSGSPTSWLPREDLSCCAATRQPRSSSPPSSSPAAMPSGRPGR